MLAGNGGINNKLTFRKSFGLNLGKSGESVYVPKISQNSNKKKTKFYYTEWKNKNGIESQEDEQNK